MNTITDSSHKPDRKAFEEAKLKILGTQRQRLGIGTLAEKKKLRIIFQNPIAYFLRYDKIARDKKRQAERNKISKQIHIRKSASRVWRKRRKHAFFRQKGQCDLR